MVIQIKISFSTQSTVHIKLQRIRKANDHGVSIPMVDKIGKLWPLGVRKRLRM